MSQAEAVKELDPDPRIRSNPLIKVLSRVSFIPLFLLGTILLGFSLIPVYFLVDFALGVYDGLTGFRILDVVFLMMVLAASYFLFGLTMILVGPALRLFLLARSKEGTVSFYSWRLTTWSIINGIIIITRQFFLEITRTTILLNLFYRLMGMKVGKRVIINTTYIYDPDLVELGDEATIGGDALILPHIAEGRTMRFDRIVIGKGADIGQSCVLMSGVVVGEGARVGAMSVVPKGTHIPPHEVWGGVPARRIRKASGHR